ncbi:hypothetical protein F4782DRAFT_95579 [Xylaria castorea]|nr:hypothetical protein F4782DRAFT_95579 [Xylaria castorea]
MHPPGTMTSSFLDLLLTGIGILDIDAVEKEFSHADELDLLPAGFDEQELTAARDYNELVEEDLQPRLQSMAFSEGPAEPERLPIVSVQRPTPRALPIQLQREQVEDISTLVPHRQNIFSEISDFQLAFGLYAHIFGMNRTEYAALRELMALIQKHDDKDAIFKDIMALPSQLATLKDRVSKRFPLMDMRKATIPLNVEKLPTEKATRKLQEHDVTSKTVMSEFHAIDPVSLFTAFMRSEVANTMHIGLAHFVDNPCELFHSHSWASSIRTTSGRFAHVLDENGQRVDVIFPSDVVLYVCPDSTCGCQDADANNPNMAHIGRVYGVGQDHRTAHCTEQKGETALQIQELFTHINKRPATLTPPHPFTGQAITIQQEENELLLNLDILNIPEENVVQNIKDIGIVIDYYWGETMSDPSPATTSKASKESMPKYMHTPEIKDHVYLIRRAISQNQLIPMCHTHPIRGELEISTYGREVFEKWDDPMIFIRSCPILVFIDGFGVYRNSYRSLVGLYAIPAALNGEERNRPTNIFPITLSPHGSNFDDAIKALQSLGDVDGGVPVTMDGDNNVIMVVPTLCYIGDMPQQDKNAGFRGPKANKFCRFCHIGQKAVKSGNPSDVLNFDIITHGRYHHQAIEMRRELESKPSNAKAKAYASQWGLSDEKPALRLISPALDLVLSRPPDPAHSEYQGMSELMHTLLIDGILADRGKSAYTRQLRVWPFPPGWERLQSPLHHLRSYSLSAHARWSVIIPGMLRSWLKPEFIHRQFLAEGCKRLNAPEQGVVDYIVAAYAKLAKSNSVLMGLKISAEDRAQIGTYVRNTRETYQQLCLFTSQSIIDNPRAYSRAGTRGLSVVRGRAESVVVAPGAMPPPPIPSGTQAAEQSDTPMVSVEGQDPEVARPKRATEYISSMTRPNVHMGIHYPLMAEELIILRWMKKKVYETNHSNVEKLLLMKVNMQLTIRFLLRSAYWYTDSELTNKMDVLHKACPTLFESVLPQAERKELLLDDEQEYELDAAGGADYEHRRATVIGQISVKSVNHIINDSQPLPTRHAKMSDAFRAKLRGAYVKDYRQPEIYMFQGRIQYANKFGFTDR